MRRFEADNPDDRSDLIKLVKGTIELEYDRQPSPFEGLIARHGNAILTWYGNPGISRPEAATDHRVANTYEIASLTQVVERHSMWERFKTFVLKGEILPSVRTETASAMWNDVQGHYLRITQEPPLPGLEDVPLRAPDTTPHFLIPPVTSAPDSLAA